jgi:hypothetical protein
MEGCALRRTACAVLAFCAPVAHAHHGFGTFDMTKEIEITGTVTDLAFVNPHSWLYLDVTGADGTRVPMRCEMRSATTLRRPGWTPQIFPVGGQVTIKGSPGRNEATACYVSTPVFADGSSIDRYGQRTPPVGVATARAGRGLQMATRTSRPLGRRAARHGRSAWRDVVHPSNVPYEPDACDDRSLL